jgi:hypothetical protein
MLLTRRTPWPARVEEPPRLPPSVDGADAVVTFIGHVSNSDDSGKRPDRLSEQREEAVRQTNFQGANPSFVRRDSVALSSCFGRVDSGTTGSALVPQPQP